METIWIDGEGTLWTAVAHIITGVIGAGVLSLAWSMAQLGWIAGPLATLLFASIIFISSSLLWNCYRTPDPELGPIRNRSYIEAVDMNLGEKNTTSSTPMVSAKSRLNCSSLTMKNCWLHLYCCSTTVSAVLQDISIHSMKLDNVLYQKEI